MANGEDVIITKKSKPICNVPLMNFGNIALDSGYLIFTEEEKNSFIIKEPKSEKWFKILLGARELLYNEKRYCLWLKDALPNELKEMKHVTELANKVKQARLSAKDKGTQKLAVRPYQFRDLNNPNKYIAIPITTGESRAYIPMIYSDNNSVPAVTIQVISNGDLFLFGQLMSQMHMAWVKYVCGRLKSDFRYSKDIVYNNHPFPQGVTDAQHKKVEAAAQAVLDVRAKYPDSSLADLYDSLSMPPDLVKAHQALDKAVDLCYRPQAFPNELSRIEFLFGLYAQYTAPMFLPEKKKKGGKKKA